MASTIKVDNVQNQPGTNIINKCSVTTTIGAGAGETVAVCAATVNLGRSGGTVNLTSGATQTGFGRTGTVDWQTGDIKTAAFIPTTGKGYFVNTTGGAVTVNLPAGTAGDIIGLKDYANTWDSYAVTLNPNGSEKIGGGNTSDPTLASEGGAILLVYVDGIQGWLTTQESVTASPTGKEDFVVATGGTPCAGAICGDYKVHTFTGPGTFCVASLATCAGNNAVDYMIVAGGAGGAGKNHGGGVGGGGAGGVWIGTAAQPSPLSPAPLVGPGFTVSATGYPILIGAGGACSTNMPSGTAGYAGNPSSGFSKTAAGGGGGNDANDAGAAGGSGGGGGEAGGAAGAGNTPATPIAQGNPGGTGNSPSQGAGGGGFTAAGESSTPSPTSPTGAGGDGINAGPIFGTANGSPSGYFAGGGGTSSGNPPTSPYPGGLGGGGTGNDDTTASTSGVVNTGGGGGAHGATGAPQGGTNAGGSGIVIIRYKFQ